MSILDFIHLKNIFWIFLIEYLAMTPYAVFLSEIEPNNGKHFGDRAKIFP